MKRVLCAVIIFTVLMLPSMSVAQESAPTADDVKEAADEFDLGRRAFKAKEFVEAAEHFESADQHTPSPTALELAIRSRDRAGQLERAATLSALAERRHPDEVSLKSVTEGILKRARAEIHETTVLCDTPCALVVGNKIVHGKAATEWSVFLEPGSHSVRAGWSGGRTVSQQVEAMRGGSGDLTFKEPPEEKKAEPADTPVEPDDAAPSEAAGVTGDQGVAIQPRGWPPLVFFVGAGVTVALGGITAWSGIDTVNNPGKETVRAQCVGEGTNCAEYQEGQRKEVRTNVLAVTTGVLGAATILVGVFATNWRGKPAAAAFRRSGQAQSARATIEPWIGIDSGATLGAVGRF